MEKIVGFRVCDSSRMLRHIVPALPTLNCLIEQATHIYQRNFSKVVLEADGCLISNDFVLSMFTGNLLMLLTSDEVWAQEDTVTESDFETDIKGHLFIPNQSNVAELHTSDSDNVQATQHVHSMQIGPNEVTIVSNLHAAFETAADQLPSEKEDESEAEIPNDEPTIPNDEPVDMNKENQSPNTSGKRGQEVHSGYQVTKRPASNDMKFRAFEIKWDKVSDNTISKLNKLQEYRLKNTSNIFPKMMRLTKQETCGLVNCIVDQLRAIDTNIHASIMETVAKDILRKYPCLEIIDDDGYGDGLSYVVFKHKLINHNSYLNRFKDVNTPSPVQANNKRNVRAGTSKEYWIKKTSECTKEILAKLRRDEPGLLTCECLESSQAFIRYRLDEHQNLKTLLLEMPVLRRRQLLYYHFKAATGTNIETLRAFFSSKRIKIIEYSAAVVKPGKLLESCSDIDVFRFMASMVGENLDALVLKKEVGTRMEDINCLVAGPVLIAIDMGNANTMYYVYAEQTRLSEGTEDFVGAVQDLLSVHYVYNFMYLKEASKLLELVQQYFLKIIPSKGSKSSASRVGPIQRVVKKVIETLSLYDAAQPGPSHVNQNVVG